MVNETLSYLNRVKKTLDQKSRILLIIALIFSYLHYCNLILGKCSGKLQYEVQKCINFPAKRGKQLEIFTPRYYETTNGLTSIVSCG